jgi:signal transduction histidine kinase
MPETSRASGSTRQVGEDTRILPVEDILDILRLILRVEPLDVLLQKIVDTISDAFGIARVSLGVLDEKTNLFCPRALHGFPPESSVVIKKHGYTLERMKTDLRPELKIGPGSYFVRVEDQEISYDDEMDYIVNVELVDVPRSSPSDWHEMDYIDFIMTDRLGNWIGWIEIDEPTDRKVPSKDVVDRIQILADLAAIAIENSKIYEDALNAMSDSQGYLDLIVHDIGNTVDPMLHYMNLLISKELPEEKRQGYTKNVIAAGESIKNLVTNVRKFSEARASELPQQEKFHLKEVIMGCVPQLKRGFPTKNIVVRIDCQEPLSPIRADDLIHDLFMNIMCNAAKYSHGPTAEMDINVIEGHSAVTVRIADHGRGIPDSKKAQIFSRFARRPDGVTGTGLGLSIVLLLVERYRGLISVEDRIPGDFSQGACFQISFPKVMNTPNEITWLKS